MSQSSAALASDLADVVVIDDEESIREGCRQALESEGWRAAVASDGQRGLRLVEKSKPRLVLLDLRMPSVGGIELLEKLGQIDPRIVPIVITGYGTVETAVTSMKLGAFDFIAKPFDMDQLLEVVSRGMTRYAAMAGAKAVAPAAVVEAPVARPDLHVVKPPRPMTEADVLLSGLEALGNYYSVGSKDLSLSDQLRALESEARHHSRVLGQIQQEEKAVSELLADFKLVDEVVASHDYKKNALIQVMLDIQARKHWLSRHVIHWISRRLNVPLARIYKIASFYEAFSLTPQGAHTVQVCLGTACHVRKAPGLLAMASSVLGVEPGQTDPTMQFTLKTVNCLGCCALAPVMKVDDAYYGNPSLKKMREVFANCEKSEATPCEN
jgi:NADH-quinone oxidoreductase subunit E